MMTSKYEHYLLRENNSAAERDEYNSRYSPGSWFSTNSNRRVLIALLSSMILNTILSGQCLYLSRTGIPAGRSSYGI